MKKGIDVSKHQGRIDWEKVKASGVEFAMIRAGYGQGHIDAQFKRNVSECNRLGIPCGVYWFSYALNTDQAVKEAVYCLEAIKPFKIEYPVAFDFEYDSVDYAAKKGVKITRAEASKIAGAFCETVILHGYHAMNYTNRDYMNRFFNDEVNSRYPLWLAQWPEKPNLENPPKCHIWQYSSKGKVPGIAGDVDMDAAYVDYSKGGKDNGKVQEENQEEGVQEMTYYETLEQIPAGELRETIKDLVDLGIVKGTDKGLHLSEDMVRILVYLRRASVI